MFDHYEWFKKEVYRLTQIDLNYYKEKQMRRRIDTLARKNGADSYETYIEMISTDKAKFKQFINFITINVSEFYRNPDQWSFLDREVIPEILKNNKGTIKIWSAACSTDILYEPSTWVKYFFFRSAGTFSTDFAL